MQWIKKGLSSLIGRRAEDIACDYLRHRGLGLVQKNYRCRYGEIDLVMQAADIWVFVEVKYRSGSDFGQAVEYFHQRKRKKIIITMQHFMHEHHINPALVDYRIDLLAIQGQHIEWFQQV